MRIIDISLPIHKKMPIYPNNAPLRIKPMRTKLTYLSDLALGSHTGTHLDAPRHVFKKGLGADRVGLERLAGPCRVLDMTKIRGCIKISDLKKAKIKKGERILVKTRNSVRGFKKFYSDYVYLDGEAAGFLAGVGIFLFGIDSLSVKQKGSMDNRPHTKLLEKNIPIIEGLDLSRASPGRYFLAALPLKLVGLDGAPARAVLIKNI